MGAIFLSEQLSYLLQPSTLIHQCLELLHSLGQPHVHLGMNLAVAHIGLEGSYHSCRMDIWDVPMDPTESM